LLEDVFVYPAVIRRLRSCVLGIHIDDFCTHLVDLGYTCTTVQKKVFVIEDFARWMQKEQVAVDDLDEQRAAQFVRAQRRRGYRCRGTEWALLQIIEQLRGAGVVPLREPTRDDSPAATLLSRYEEHLRRERALAPSTIAVYRYFVRKFLIERLDNSGVLDVLKAGAIRDFLLVHVRRLSPRRAQTLGNSLRSFLRFLFSRGETAVDLSFAVPTVRQWRLSAVPRHLPAQDVERLLRLCDVTSATGRRDHAILLLLARLGLRAGEVLALELDDLDWQEAKIVVRGKGLTRDYLPLLPDVGAAIALYLRKDRPPGRSRRLFLCMKAPRRGFSNSHSITSIVVRAFARAGLHPPLGGAHTLRHSLAREMLRRGASLTEIGEVLRHRSAKTTEIYAKLDFDALREVALPWPLAGGER
jgi:site-specific recombinase XerD